MKVMKFGGSCLKNSRDFLRVAEIIKDEKYEKIVVISGVNSITDLIYRNIEGKNYDEEKIKKLVGYLGNLHLKIASGAIENSQIFGNVEENILKKLQVLERLLYGVCYMGELPDKTRDIILSYGERLSVPILEGVLLSQGVKAKALEADKIGILTDENFGNATANLPAVRRNMKRDIIPLVKKGIVSIVTGFFGCDSKGRTTLFGRNGSDYSASVIAYGVDADLVEIWKDVDGFLSADPKIVKDAHLIDSLSYDEAAELAYFGARILHPRTVEPLKLKNIPLRIKNIYKREGEGTLIHSTSKIRENKIIKSVACKKEIGCLKIHGTDVESNPGILREVISYLSENRINIESVIASQTCITLLLEREDVERSYRILSLKNIKTVEKIEKVKNISLIGIAGEKVLEYPGIAARVFRAVAKKKINIEMIFTGASRVAFCFIIKRGFLEDAIKATHKVFFNGDEKDEEN